MEVICAKKDKLTVNQMNSKLIWLSNSYREKVSSNLVLNPAFLIFGELLMKTFTPKVNLFITGSLL